MWVRSADWGVLSTTMCVVLRSKKRSEYLENLFNAVMTAKPTSVESERSFSVGGGFATKIRSRLSDKSLSALVMLKMYFKSKRNQ